MLKIKLNWPMILWWKWSGSLFAAFPCSDVTFVWPKKFEILKKNPKNAWNSQWLELLLCLKAIKLNDKNLSIEQDTKWNIKTKMDVMILCYLISAIKRYQIPILKITYKHNLIVILPNPIEHENTVVTIWKAIERWTSCVMQQM